MANKKVINKKWDINKISSNLSPEELLDAWKEAMLVEAATRKNAFKSLLNFKKWWANYLKAVILDDKVDAIRFALSEKKKLVDVEKDWLDERKRILSNVNKKFEKLERVDKMMIKYQKEVRKFLLDSELKKYKTKIELDFFNNIQHQINDIDKAKVKAAWGTKPFEEIYHGLFRDKKIDLVRDSKGNLIPNNTTWNQAYTCADRVTRKNTYIAEYSLEREQRKTLFVINKYISSRLNQEASYYNYYHWIHYMCEEVLHVKYNDYIYIINQASKFANFNLKYFSHNSSLIVGAYDLAEYAPWDRSFLIQNTNDEISIVQAKQLVKDGLACLGQEYVDKLDICYKNNIINWENKQKTNQNFCLSVNNNADEHMINFKWDGSSCSTITLAHELGHNIRNKFLKENNEINNWSNRITSEIPSIVNSVLMSFYLLNKFKKDKAPNVQLYGIYRYILDYISYCLNSSGYIANFVHLCAWYMANEENFKAGDMEQMYIDLKKKYFGISEANYKKACKKFPYSLEKFECYDVFFNNATDWRNSIPYYVGAIVAISVANKIFHGDKETLNKYYKFLKSGTSTNPIKVINDTLGINLLKPAIYTEVKQIINKLNNEFIKDIKIKN